VLVPSRTHALLRHPFDPNRRIMLFRSVKFLCTKEKVEEALIVAELG
jgi:hypothetical protein